MKYNWLTLKLLTIFIVVFIFQTVFPEITDYFALDSSAFLVRPWTIITYIFMHADVQHLFYNMVAFVTFGLILERLIGGKRFLITFFASGVIAGLGSLIFYPSSIGASGAIYGILGTLVVLRPKMIVFLLSPLPLIVVVLLWMAGDLIGLTSNSGIIGYAAHLSGLIFGLAYGIYLRKRYSEKKLKKETRISENEFKEWENRWLKSSYSDL
jgi:membrane associated rhomboid family serine protease